MRSRIISGRIISGSGLVLVGLLATLAALIYPVWSYEDRSGTHLDALTSQSVSTRFGPLSALDRDFITKVRLAGLWELPAGQQAGERGTTRAVHTAGKHLVEGHTFLDARVREVAAALRLELPSQPSAQQRRWLDELSAARGAAYDERFANILRRAHGKVFSLVAEVRATTRNSLVRALADDANTTVLDHIQVLEATGLVDFDGLARDAASADPRPPTRSPAPPGPQDSPPTAPPASATAAPSFTFPLPPPVSRPNPRPSTS
ncbi:DUF4142 domain-containing protein [Streptomyces lasiicapitis]|uniref:DUF4142 domain-containing protein n=1 Tax=Streptomyces TaxID=1883 RepID=UPI0013DBD57D|nr:DUF4142 domain-containing protein [Streptomyces aureoverticillatus]QIB42964.1 DUF4142 domain-containing protein [Streptomyces aureoverticillatus]